MIEVVHMPKDETIKDARHLADFLIGLMERWERSKPWGSIVEIFFASGFQEDREGRRPITLGERYFHGKLESVMQRNFSRAKTKGNMYTVHLCTVLSESSEGGDGDEKPSTPSRPRHGKRARRHTRLESGEITIKTEPGEDDKLESLRDRDDTDTFLDWDDNWEFSEQLFREDLRAREEEEERERRGQESARSSEDPEGGEDTGEGSAGVGTASDLSGGPADRTRFRHLRRK